ncbi:MAG: hypothetical protein ACIALR_05000, partial [Blastopirellula sp. JB062]
MNVIAISTLSPQHRYVLAKLHATIGIDHVIQPIWPARPATRAQYAKLLKTPWAVLRRRFRAKYDNLRGERHHRAVNALLGDRYDDGLA